MKKNCHGDKDRFNTNWRHREETHYTHWIREEPKNQIQLAFRMHWNLFQEIIRKNNINGKKCLEVGCGRGTISAYFSDAGYDCTLVDISENVLEIAKGIFKKNKLKGQFVKGDTESIPFPDDSFDMVFSIGLLEHFEDPSSAIKEQIRILRKNGLFLGYIVPYNPDNIQKNYEWINEILKGYINNQQFKNIGNSSKQPIFRSDYNSKFYIDILKTLPVKNINISGVYPLPMISHSVDFPFSLMPEKCELELVKYFMQILKERENKYKRNPWLCDENNGQAFLVWWTKE